MPIGWGGGLLSPKTDPELKEAVDRIEEKIEAKDKKNTLLWVVSIIIVVLLSGVAIYLTWPNREGQSDVAPQSSYKDIAYSIEGNSVLLVNGFAEREAASGSASKITTRYFGNEAAGDLNGDAVSDVAFLLTQSTGGSGTFYYVVVAIKTAGGYQGTDAFFLGDRIAPQTTEIRDGEIIVNYAIRKPEEPMTARPSLGVSKYFSVTGLTLVEIR